MLNFNSQHFHSIQCNKQFTFDLSFPILCPCIHEFGLPQSHVWETTFEAEGEGEGEGDTAVHTRSRRAHNAHPQTRSQVAYFHPLHVLECSCADTIG